MSAAALGKPMSGASAHLIASSWTSANTFRRSLALNLKGMPQREKAPQSIGSFPPFRLGVNHFAPYPRTLFFQSSIPPCPCLPIQYPVLAGP
jgi:hypothetical protein